MLAEFNNEGLFISRFFEDYILGLNLPDITVILLLSLVNHLANSSYEIEWLPSKSSFLKINYISDYVIYESIVYNKTTNSENCNPPSPDLSSSLNSLNTSICILMIF